MNIKTRKNTQRLSLDFTMETYKNLEKLSTEYSLSKKEVVKKAVSLLVLALDEQKKGNSLGFFNEKKKYRKEFIFLL